MVSIPFGRRPEYGRGFTLIELLVVMAIVAMLVSIAAPRYFKSVERARENTLATSLKVMRGALDQFAADKGRYPESLTELVDARYLRAIPEDPITTSQKTWLVLAPPIDMAATGKVFDVRSGAATRGADGRLYADW
jgi:general secretion pathway protein G